MEREMAFEVFEKLELEIIEAITILQDAFMGREDICIYMPYYINNMFSNYLTKNYMPNIKSETLDEFHGCKIINGYEDKIVISHKDIPFRIDQQPIIIEYNATATIKKKL